MQHRSNQLVFIQQEEDPYVKSESLDTIKSLSSPLKTQPKPIPIKRQGSKKAENITQTLLSVQLTDIHVDKSEKQKLTEITSDKKPRHKRNRSRNKQRSETTKTQSISVENNVNCSNVSRQKRKRNTGNPSVQSIIPITPMQRQQTGKAKASKLKMTSTANISVSALVETPISTKHVTQSVSTKRARQQRSQKKKCTSSTQQTLNSPMEILPHLALMHSETPRVRKYFSDASYNEHYRIGVYGFSYNNQIITQLYINGTGSTMCEVLTAMMALQYSNNCYITENDKNYKIILYTDNKKVLSLITSPNPSDRRHYPQFFQIRDECVYPVRAIWTKGHPKQIKNIVEQMFDKLDKQVRSELRQYVKIIESKQPEC
ncbi:unnamed protein product [Didymodactylos carnosus]|uniref:RNase H type-1 domain-containing protein n=1 Tax=Didymodactylos carnosus TaxID=1234261 RepID=A0A815WLW1_9BILA|nr:unnamed protein product [Didymodactylos carnosus]CAF4405737.1 unnamed protein product [Didymodactylos carnosus]